VGLVTATTEWKKGGGPVRDEWTGKCQPAGQEWDNKERNGKEYEWKNCQDLLTDPFCNM